MCRPCNLELACRERQAVCSCRTCRAVVPDPSPVPSIGLGSFVYDTPDAMPPARGPLFSGGRPGSAGRHIGAARHLSGGPGMGRASNRLGGGLITQLHMDGVGRQSQQNDKRQSLGLPFPVGKGPLPATGKWLNRL